MSPVCKFRWFHCACMCVSVCVGRCLIVASLHLLGPTIYSLHPKVYSFSVSNSVVHMKTTSIPPRSKLLSQQIGRLTIDSPSIYFYDSVLWTLSLHQTFHWGCQSFCPPVVCSGSSLLTSTQWKRQTRSWTACPYTTVFFGPSWNPAQTKTKDLFFNSRRMKGHI